MDSGRELLRDLREGLDDGELSREVGAATCSPSEGVVADEDADGASLERCRNAAREGESTESGLEACIGREDLLRKDSVLGDDVGVGVLESLRGAESWVINERTFMTRHWSANPSGGELT